MRSSGVAGVQEFTGGEIFWLEGEDVRVESKTNREN
jgi:hypothetical protein